MVGTTHFDVEEFRKRIQKLNDTELIRFGKAARYMADPANGTVEPIYRLQLKECRAEWRRRHPK